MCPLPAAAGKAFASQADLQDKHVTFAQLSRHCWAYTTEGDPNSGVIIGECCIMVVDATATPAMAQDLIARIRAVSDKPIQYVLLTHYHAVRVLGASAYRAEGASAIIASQGTHDLIVERGAQDMQSEMERFPRLFRQRESVPGLTWPTLVIDGGNPARQVTDADGCVRAETPGRLKLDLGGVQVEVWHPGPGHTSGDTIAWIDAEKVLFSGDLVECDAGVYTGDAHLEEWPTTLATLRALAANALVPGRGAALQGAAEVERALDFTQRWVQTLYRCAREAVARKLDLKAAMAHTRLSMDPLFGQVFLYEHCLPFDVSRAFDEASGIKHPRIWTAQRDREMWAALQA